MSIATPKCFLFIKEFLVKAEDYIQHLKLSDGKLILNSNRRTGFQGLIVCIRSLMNLYDNLLYVLVKN